MSQHRHKKDGALYAAVVYLLIPLVSGGWREARDLTDLGLESIPLARINDYPPAGEIALPRGVIFSSYSSLIAAAKTGEKRIDQIQRWLGPNGVVVFDEAHKAKNALAGGRGEPTLTGQAVIDLQDPERNRDYRVVYL